MHINSCSTLAQYATSACNLHICTSATKDADLPADTPCCITCKFLYTTLRLSQTRARAVNGDLATAIRMYNRLRLQGLQPDMQTMRALFKCVRMYATNVRVVTARSISQAKAGDR